MMACIFPGGGSTLKRTAIGVATGGLSELGGARLLKDALVPDIPPPTPASAKGIPGRADPKVAAARERLRLSEKKRIGRRASILTDSGGVNSNDTLIKRASKLGETGASV